MKKQFVIQDVKTNMYFIGWHDFQMSVLGSIEEALFYDTKESALSRIDSDFKGMIVEIKEVYIVE